MHTMIDELRKKEPAVTFAHNSIFLNYRNVHVFNGSRFDVPFYCEFTKVKTGFKA